MNLRVSVKMGIGFGLVLVGVALGSVLMALSLGKAIERAGRIRAENLPLAMHADRMTLAAVQVQQFLTDASATGNRDSFGEAEEWVGVFRESLAIFRGIFGPRQDTRMLAELDALEKSFGAMYEVGKRMAEAYISQGREAGNELMAQFDSRTDDLRERIDPLRDTQLAHADAQMRAMTDQLAGDLRAQYLYLAGALLIGVIAAVTVSRGITRQLGAEPGEVARYARLVAEGRIEEVLSQASGKACGVMAAMLEMAVKLKASFAEAESQKLSAQNRTFEAESAKNEADAARKAAERARLFGLAEAADRLEHMVQALASAGEELSEQVRTVSQGAGTQQQRIGETATAMEEMNASVLEVAANAGRAAESAGEAEDRARSGLEIVTEVSAAVVKVRQRTEFMKTSLHDLGAHAEGIGRIMSVIQDIADQTNLLALNAAIEAARAGDAGRGFAVVADEVRKLAEKTMHATGEVGSVINSIQAGVRRNISEMDNAAEEVAGTTRLAHKAGEMLTAIVDKVHTASDQVRSIAAASEQQSAASEQVNRAVVQINRISEETVAGMNTAENDLSELSDLAGRIKRFIDDLRRESQGKC